MPPFSFYLHIILQYAIWFFICFGLFSLLARVCPNIRGQRIFRRGMAADLWYWFAAPLFYIYAGLWIITALSVVFFYNMLEAAEFRAHGFGVFIHLPLLLQFFIALFATDLIQYWSHRLFHGKRLWRFHVIHHSPKELDWLSAVRFHPVNILVHSVLVGSIVSLFGFSPAVFVMQFPFYVFYAAMVHANLNWTFGPLKYVFASPVFHRFHHTSPEEGGEKNFAPILSFFDLLFGTFYMPQGVLPMVFGVKETVPETIVGQLMYPFKKE